MSDQSWSDPIGGICAARAAVPTLLKGSSELTVDFESGAVRPHPSAQIVTPAFASEVAMMCSRVARTAMFRAGMAPSSATWRVVRYIDRNGPVCISDVARRERSTMATVSTLVNRLVNEGLITKSKDPNDARQVLLTATDKGRNTCDEWEKELGAAAVHDFARLTPQELEILAAALPVMRKIVIGRDAPQSEEW